MLTRYQKRKLSDSIEILDVFKHYNLRVLRDGMGRYSCFCPFHYERTASLKIYPEENSWYAFCCSSGSTVWDFIRKKEDTYEHAEQVLKELATIDLPDDPLEDLAQELREKTLQDLKKEVIKNATIAGLLLRDFLSSHQDTNQYPQLVEEVDKWFYKIDELLDYEDVEPEEVQELITDIKQYIQERL